MADEKTSKERLQDSAEKMAQVYFDDMVEHLSSNRALLRMTRFFLMQKFINVLDKQPTPIGDAISGHEVISWILGICMRIRKSHPKKEKTPHRFEA